MLRRCTEFALYAKTIDPALAPCALHFVGRRKTFFTFQRRACRVQTGCQLSAVSCQPQTPKKNVSESPRAMNNTRDLTCNAAAEHVYL